MRTEFTNTKTDGGWNYTRLTEIRTLTERVQLATRMLRYGVVELELFWKGDEVFMDAVSLRIGKSRADKFTVKEDDDAETEA